MRSKVLVWAGAGVLVIVGLIVGVRMWSQANKDQQQATQQAGQQAADRAEDAGPGSVVNVTKGGPAKINDNLEQLQQNVQQKMDQRPGKLNRAVDRSKTGR